MILVTVSTTCLLVKLKELHHIAILSVSTICLWKSSMLIFVIAILVSTTCLLVKLKEPHTIAISVSTTCLLVEELHIIAILVSTTCLLCLRYVGPSKQLGVNQLFAWAHISQPVCIVFGGPCLHNDMGLGCLPMFLGCSSPTYLCVLIAGAPPDRVGVHHKNQQTAHSLI